MTDNSAALRRSRQRDSNTKRQRSQAALQAMEQTGEAISFPGVARRAQVSVSLLYADRDLAGRIAAARDRQRQAGRDRAWRLPARSLVTDQSVRTDLANARAQNNQLTDEIKILHDRLAHQLGAEADLASGRAMSPLLDQLEQRAAELEADNARLRQHVDLLQHQARELTDTLDAARAMNRELMSELNRPTPPTAARTGPRGNP